MSRRCECIARTTGRPCKNFVKIGSTKCSQHVLLGCIDENIMEKQRYINIQIQQLYKTYRNTSLYNKLQSYNKGIETTKELENRTKEEDESLQLDIEFLEEWKQDKQIEIQKAITEIKEKEIIIRNTNEMILKEDMFIPFDELKITVCKNIKLISVLSPKRAGISNTIVFLGLKEKQPVIVKIGLKHSLANESEIYDEIKDFAQEIPQKLMQCNIDPDDFDRLYSSSFLISLYPILNNWLFEQDDLETMVIEQVKGEPLAVMYGDIHTKQNNLKERQEFDFSIWIQIAHLIVIFENHNFLHDDLHANNIFVETLDTPKILDFEIQGKKFKTKYIVSIIDFDRSRKSTSEDHNRDWIRFLNQYNSLETQYSMPYIENIDTHWKEMKKIVNLKITIEKKFREGLLSPKEFLKSQFINQLLQ